MDYGWIGEDANGVWTTRHPLAALAEHPEVEPILGRWDSGLRELTPQDHATLSAWEWDALACMQAAAQRRDMPRRSGRG